MIIRKVPGDMDGLSAGRVLAKQLYMEELPELFEAGKVRCLPLGKKLTATTPVRRGSTILVMTDKSADDCSLLPEIAYEDEEFLVYNKPQGMYCIHDTDAGANLYRYAAQRMEEQGLYDVDMLRVPYVCNLLDKDMGGLVIVAKDQILFENMLEALKERRIKRVYRAIVTGEPEQEALLYGYMERGKGLGKPAMQAQMNRNARPAALKYRLIERREELALIEIEPLSNYRQQIPLQLAQAGLPVLGDKQYGNAEMNKKYTVYTPALWAHRIVFETGKNNSMEYLNGKVIEGSTSHMPGIGYFTEREEPLLRVEPLNEKQIRQAAKLALDSFQTHVAPGYSKQGVQVFRDFAKPAKLLKAAAEQALQMYGCFGPEGMAGMAACKPDGHISMLFVQTAWQRRGAGTLLMDALRQDAKEAGVLRLTVNAAPDSAAFYEKCGFTILSEEMEQDGIRFIPMEQILQ